MFQLRFKLQPPRAPDLAQKRKPRLPRDFHQNQNYENYLKLKLSNNLFLSLRNFNGKEGTFIVF